MPHKFPCRAMKRSLLLPLLLAVSLSGCDLLGIESGSVTAAKKEAEGKAVGGACRHAMRAIEDCYTLNPKAQKAAVYAGWREMDEYLRETKGEGIAPVIPRTPPKTAAQIAAEAASAAEAQEAHDAAEAEPAPHGKSGRTDKAAPKRQATTH